MGKEVAIYYDESEGDFAFDVNDEYETDWQLVEYSADEIAKTFCSFVDLENAYSRTFKERILSFNEVYSLWELFMSGVRCGVSISETKK